MSVNKFVIAISLMALCCSPNCDWSGGEIREYGEFCNTEVNISVDEKDNFLKYEVRNKKGDVLIVQDMNISVVQSWGLFFDNKKNLWVFSSDVGTSVWERDSKGKYHNRAFYRELTKDDVPQELYESSLKRFLKQ